MTKKELEERKKEIEEYQKISTDFLVALSITYDIFKDAGIEKRVEMLEELDKVNTKYMFRHC